MAFLGGIASQGFFWGIGIYDKQIDFAQENAADFQPLHVETAAEKVARYTGRIAGIVAQLQPNEALALVQSQVTQLQPAQAQQFAQFQQFVAHSAPQHAAPANVATATTTATADQTVRRR
jgi:hypothetical protein